MPGQRRQPYDQRPERERHQQADQELAGGDRRTLRLSVDQLGLEQHLARRVDARGGYQDVARAGREEVGHVEAGAAAQHARHALLEQQPLDELGLGEVA